ncbi:unnamed protein product [Rotaria socialis]|uniref:Secreted protein n=1 Tax=Rotaria socialis TaxID=392032 RepID=A0A818H9W8_9BILA|nr:unnamed protein product [Rotaria socialis]
MISAVALVVSIVGIIMFTIGSNPAATTIKPVSTKVPTQTVTTNYMTTLVPVRIQRMPFDMNGPFPLCERCATLLNRL